GGIFLSSFMSDVIAELLLQPYSLSDAERVRKLLSLSRLGMVPLSNASTWPINYPQHCNGTRQSPINIVSASARPNDNLTEIHFENYNDTSKIDFIENNDNTGENVRVKLKEGVNITGGNLSGQYQTVQFHFHWGNGSSVPGSDHTVDGKRYPMEVQIFFPCHNGDIDRSLWYIHITNKKKIQLYHLIFPVAYCEHQPESWRNLTSYLAKITERGNTGFSLKDLLGNVSLSKYYRYLGSLTTPNCSEAVVWTVFKEPIKVSKDLIDLFSTTVHFNNSTSQLMTNVYRSLQPAQQVWTQSIKASASTTCFSLGPLLLSFALGWSWS
uniref:Alpha-carbonic anhydrase domain-containing protein n=1 Tax=Oreochromis niloticus TaxID=8128 RepID=A0A669BXH0_ORENI